MKTKIWILLLLPLCLFVACDELGAGTEDFAELDDVLSHEAITKKPAIKVKSLKFSPDYKRFVITTQMNDDIGPYSLTDSSDVKIDIEESTGGILKTKRTQPHLIKIRNLKGDNVSKAGVKALVLINKTLPQPELDKIRNYVGELTAIFTNNNLYVAFMDGNTVSETMLVTDYVLTQHFKRSDNEYVYLYRSILEKKQEMTSHTGIWADAKKMALLIFSDVALYDNNTDEPLDPSHYQMEEQMIANDSVVGPNFAAYYASINYANHMSDIHEDNVLKLFCQNNHGNFMEKYNGVKFKDYMLNAFHISQDANDLTFENPDGKVYRGERQTLTIHFRDAKNDSIITSFSTNIQEGSIFNPIIVNGEPILVVVMQGITLGAFLILIIWIIFQFIIPIIRYRIFQHKYVLHYTGGNMGIGETMVQETCYLCKQPFEVGDEIVAKCAHTMHKSCWDENDYHCPEYSDRCKHGSHYFNSQNLLDKNNASFYMKWILMGITAAIIAWVFCSLRLYFINNGINSIILLSLYGLKSGTPEAQALLRDHIITHMPAFGLYIGLFLTFGIALLSLYIRNIRHNIKNVLLRSVIAALGCYTFFFITNTICVILDIEDNSYIVDWIPWAASGYLIAVCGTYGTRVKLPKSLILLSVIIGFLSMYLWSIFYYTNVVDFRVMLLFSFILFAVGIAASVAMSAPRSERYFLKVQGAIKEIDVALYKWLRNDPNRVVSIGKSVDCSLQLSWDINGYVAPMHAEIRMQEQVPYLTALEEGIFVDGEAIVSGQTVRLYHGKSFTIGNTIFTYIEKDM